MTKAEALKAMQEGKTVRHVLFTPEEWMRAHEYGYEFEDGNKCTVNEFWRSRTHAIWNDEWSILEVK